MLLFITIVSACALLIVVARNGGCWATLAKMLAYPPVANWLIRRAMKRPYSPIIKSGRLYMDRFWLFNPYPDTGASGADRKRWQFPISIRIHHIILPDQDRDLHDHPWNARTVILRSWYQEHRLITNNVTLQAVEKLKAELPSYYRVTVYEKYDREPGDTVILAIGKYHRITDVSPGGAWTLFITGPYRGTWGFLVDGVKVKWRDYLGLNK